MALPPVSHASIHLDAVTTRSEAITAAGGNYLHLGTDWGPHLLLIGGSPEAWARFAKWVTEMNANVQLAALEATAVGGAA